MVELLVVMVVTGFFVLVIMDSYSSRSYARPRALRIQCVNNLKQTGLAYRIWEGDNGTNYPMAVPASRGGTREFITGANAFHHFQVMSNELCTPKILTCPEDSRDAATNWTYFGNSNISYFVGIDAAETNPTMILSGDHNITNGTAIRDGLLALTTNTIAGWTSDVHNKVGNILLADGSVQQNSMSGLQTQIASTDVATNWVQMPVLGP